MSFEFLLAMHVYRVTVNLFRVRVMAIYKENHLNTMISIYRYKQKPPNDTLFKGSNRLKSLSELREEFLFQVIWTSIFLSANHRAGSYQTKPPRKGWHHNKRLQQVSWPQVVLFAMLVLFSVRNGATPNPHERDICHRCTTPKWILQNLSSKNLCMGNRDM